MNWTKVEDFVWRCVLVGGLALLVVLITNNW